MFNTLNMETTILFKCNICNKKYCREKSYQRHKLFCEILNDDKGHQKNLGIYNLALIVEELVKSNDKLQKDVSELKTWVQTKKQKFIIIDWLNESYKINQTFNQFNSNITILHEDLDTIFKSNFINGIDDLLQKNIQRLRENDIDIPLKSFDQKDNTIYVFKDEKWQILSKEDLNELFSLISKELMSLFKLWQDENEYRLYTDDFSVIYINNVKKIMGGNETLDKQKKLVHRNLYKYLKVNLQNVIQYEFS